MNNINELRRLAGLPTLTEKKWVATVNTSNRPPEGLFASGAKADIIAWLKDTHKEYSSAMSALNFFINRAGKNLTADRKGVLESCKDALRKAYGVKEALEPFDVELLRRMAGLPVVEKHDTEEAENASAEEIAPEESEEETVDDSTEEELPSIITTIATHAEGKTGDDMIALVKDVYDAGFKDGVESVSESAEEEKSEETVEEAAQMIPAVGVDKEDDAGWLAVELAKAGMTVDMEEAMGVFYFNFKNQADANKAKKIAVDKEIALTEGKKTDKIEDDVNDLGKKTNMYRAEKSPSSLRAIQDAENKLVFDLKAKS